MCIFACIYVCMHVCMPACMHVCTYVYLCTQTLSLAQVYICISLKQRQRRIEKQRERESLQKSDLELLRFALVLILNTVISSRTPCNPPKTYCKCQGPYIGVRMYMVSVFILQAAGFGGEGFRLGQQALQMECKSRERHCVLADS